MTNMGRISDAHALVYANDVGTVGMATWGDIYSKLEKLRLRGLISIALAIILLLAGGYFLFSNSIILTAISLGLAGYYYRNYVGAYSMYAGLYGGRRVVIPNLRVK
jgi:hypothetical protein